MPIGAKCSGLFIFKGSQQCQWFRQFVKSAGGCIQVHLGAFKTIASLIEKGLQGAILWYNDIDKLEVYLLL